MTARSTSLLDISDLSVRFGGIHALRGVSLTLERGTALGLIGPNGAGKTTMFNCLSRLYQPSGGDILFNGQSILRLRRHEIPGRGIARTFQNVALFDELTVRENVLVGAHGLGSAGYLASGLWLRRVRTEERALARKADEAIEFMRLAPYGEARAGDLPFPIRKRIEFARALVSDPQLLLLDEPAAGLNHEEVEVLRDQIRFVRDTLRVSVLLIEHHMGLVMSVSDRVAALDFGQKIAEGTPAEVQQNPAVIRAYLGADAA